MKNLLIFLAGGAVGAVVTAKLVEKYYRQIADEEIADVVEHFKNKEKELKKLEEEKVEDNNKAEKKNTKKNEKKQASKIINSENYGEASVEEVEEKLINTPIESVTGIEIINPIDFGEEEGFDSKTWMYWNDNVLTNEFDEIVEPDDIAEFIGDALTHFGDIEQDSVYVRNRANNTDYEILKSEKEFYA